MDTRMMQLNKHLHFYREKGLSVIPIPYKTKAAKIKWEEYQRRRATEAEIESWFGNNSTNLAIVCGGVSANLVVVDCDTEEKYFEVKQIIEEKLSLDNLENRTPVVKTGKGYHIYFRTATPVKSAKFPRLDIKGEGGYILAPPSIHPNGSRYSFVNSNVMNILSIANMANIGIDFERKPDLPKSSKPNWVSEALQGVAEGERNDTCFRLAGYFKEHLPQDISEQTLLNWNSRNKPPLSEKEVRAAVDSAYTYAVNTLTYINSKREDFAVENAFSLKSGQVSGQVVDKSRGYGDLSIPFDNFLKENPEPHWKKDVAEFIGTTYKDPAFIKLVQRRAGKEDQRIRITHGGDKIQWINKDWKLSLVSLEAKQQGDLGLALPFCGEKYIQTLEHSQIVVAGDVGAGKTHFGYLLAELNVGNLPIRHFVNEIGETRAALWLDDFPNLTRAFGRDYYLINLDNEESLDVPESLAPNGLNIYDYLHLSASKEWFLILQRELARLSQKLDRGVIVVMLQKKQGASLAMGGNSTRMQAETYFNLCIEENVKEFKRCRVDVIKCRGWADKEMNPELLSFRYHTAPKYGKIVGDSPDWFICKDRA